MSTRDGERTGIKSSIAAILDEAESGAAESFSPAISRAQDSDGMRFWSGFLLLAASLALVVAAATLVVSMFTLAQALLRSGLLLGSLGLVLVLIDIYHWRQRYRSGVTQVAADGSWVAGHSVDVGLNMTNSAAAAQAARIGGAWLSGARASPWIKRRNSRRFAPE